ncbi:hypothetical protein Pst134EB_008821 [Puccinia striiformis f. sp. tritici]|nr:hypothetical protein Pst134EB_008821 [Puccinia striiformis f. sp. tritici]
MYPPSPVFDWSIRHPTPYPLLPYWSEFLRNMVLLQGSLSGRRCMNINIPLADCIGPQASGSLNVPFRAKTAVFVPPESQPRNLSTPLASPRGPPGYVPSPRAATWGQRRGSESLTRGRSFSHHSARSLSAASLADQAEVVVYHTLKEQAQVLAVAPVFFPASANPFLSPVYNPHTRNDTAYSPSPVFDRTIREPSPYPLLPTCEEF